MARIENAERVADATLGRRSLEAASASEARVAVLRLSDRGEIAAEVKCPLHGERFKTPRFHIYVAKWLREKLWRLLYSRHSEQYRKAWFASFPPELWPAEEDDTDGSRCLKLKDGTRFRFTSH